jgi:hypothetical protein
LAFKEFSFFKREADAGMPGHHFAKAQERTADEWDISIGRVQRIISQGNVAICISLCVWAPLTFVASVTLQSVTTPFRTVEGLCQEN